MNSANLQGRLLVLIHGWGFDRAVWDPVVAALPELRTYAPDLPGHGACAGGAELADVREAAGAVVAQLPAGTREPIWVGWSLGGLVALAAAERWCGPQRLALVCATPRFTRAADWSTALEPCTLDRFRQELERDRGALLRRFAALCARGARAPSVLRRRLLAAMTAHPAGMTGLRSGLAALADTDLRPVLAGLDARVAVWLTADDALVPAAAGAALAALRPDARVRSVPGGHASWLEESSALAEFLREVST